MQLNYKEYGSGKPLIILHGFLGSLDNWHTLATQFGNLFHVFAIDQRNHGKSPHTSEHNIDLMVADLKEFIDTLQLKELVIIGHSMGGKVAMQFALDYPLLVDNLIVVDIAPKQYKPGHDEVFNALFAVPLGEIENRKQAEEAMLPHLADFGTRQFLLKNIERQPDGHFKWKMNLKTLFENYENIIKPINLDKPFLGKTLFLKGANSNYIKPEDTKLIENLFPNYQIESIANAGHWVHAENPLAFYDAIIRFIHH